MAYHRRVPGRMRGLGDSVAVRRPTGSPTITYTTPGGTTIRPAVGAGVDATAAGIAQQLKLLDATGTYKASPSVCGERWATLTYSCAQWPNVLTTSAMLYEQARAAIADLATRELPTDPVQRRAYYSAVVSYAMLMTWASNLEGVDLSADPELLGYNGGTPTGPVVQGFSLGYLNSSGDVPASVHDYSAGIGGQWGPDLSTPANVSPGTHMTTTPVGAYETFWASNQDERHGTTTTSGGVHHYEGDLSSGRVFVEHAKSVAQRLASLDYVTLVHTAFSKYQTYLTTFAAHGVTLPPGDVQAIADAQVALANARSGMSDASAGATTAAGIATSIPVIGTAAALVAGAVAFLLNVLPQAHGAVWCPRGFGYRVPADMACAAAIAPPVTYAPKSSSAGLWVVGGITALALGILWWRKRP